METFLAAVIGVGAVVFLTTFFTALCRESRKGPRRSISVLEPWSENEVGVAQFQEEVPGSHYIQLESWILYDFRAGQEKSAPWPALMII